MNTQKNEKIKFLTFNDGIVKVYETDDDDCIISNSERLFRFGDRTVGVKRFYAAYQNDINLERVIHIPRAADMTTEKAVVIDNTRYKVEQVQQLTDTYPKSTVLSLSQRGLYEGETDDV